MILNRTVAALLILIFFILMSVTRANAAETKVVNIGWTGGSGWTALPDRVALERGFYEKENLRVRYIQFQGTNLMLSALMANELDYVTILPFIAGAAKCTRWNCWKASTTINRAFIPKGSSSICASAPTSPRRGKLKRFAC